jgi:hypothetical protein
MVNQDPSEIISYGHPERTGIELVAAQSAIRYFNEVLAFARNINAPYFIVCAIKEMPLLPIGAMEQSFIEQLASAAICGGRNPGLSDQQASNRALLCRTDLQYAPGMEATIKDFNVTTNQQRRSAWCIAY